MRSNVGIVKAEAGPNAYALIVKATNALPAKAEGIIGSRANQPSPRRIRSGHSCQRCSKRLRRFYGGTKVICLDDSGYNEALELVRAKNEIVLLKDALRAVEFSYKGKRCPHCHGYDGARENDFLHIPECPIARVLRSNKLVQMVYDPNDEIREAYARYDAPHRS